MTVVPAQTQKSAPSRALSSLFRLTETATVFTRQPAFRRALPSILLVGMAAIAVLAWLMLREEPTSTLYPGMSEAEKARAIEVLQGAAISASINSSGELSVPAGDFYRARMALAAEGLPESPPDSGQILSELPMGASHAVEGARLRQALETDLSRTISGIGAVKAARVHLALPERSAFLRDSHPPAASVFLTLAPGRVLDAGQINGIAHLVASSVPGLSDAAVTVVDQRGRLLSQGGDDLAGLSDRQLAHRIAVEDLLRQRIEAVIAPVVGVENLSVQVTATLDYSRHETTREMMDPDGNVLRSESQSETTSDQAPAGGIPGAVSNTPPTEPNLTKTAPPTPADAVATVEASTSRSAESVRNYEVSRTVESMTAEQGRLIRVSAAVVLRAPEGGSSPTIPAEQLAELQRLAETAIGFDKRRGDSVTVVSQPFAPAPEMVPEVASNDWLPDIARQVGLVLVVAVIGLGILRPLILRMTAPTTFPAPIAIEQEIQPGVTRIVPATPNGETAEEADGPSVRQRMLAASALGNLADREAKRDILRRIAAEDPARIAVVLHRMLGAEIDVVQ